MFFADLVRKGIDVSQAIDDLVDPTWVKAAVHRGDRAQ